MGKQILFVHLKEDVKAFLSTVENCNGLVVVDNEVFGPSQLEDFILDKMDTQFSKYFIIPCECDNTRDAKIEFSNSRRGCATSRTYEVGRLYISPTTTGEYDERALALYNQLCRYIKRNYFFSKKVNVYLSARFKVQSDAHYFFATHLGRPLIF